MLDIKTREGTDVKVRMTDNVAVFMVVKTSLPEIRDGSYIGVTGLSEPDGTEKAQRRASAVPTIFQRSRQKGWACFRFAHPAAPHIAMI